MTGDPSQAGRANLVSLQYLRAVAALLVVYFHAVLQTAQLNASESPSWPVFGGSGVDIFFVLSGYVMWITTAGRRMRPLDFLRRRVVRIVPLYWAVTFAAGVVALALPDLLRSTRFDPLHFAASLAFIPWPNPASQSRAVELLTPIIVPGWTLNMEMFFYLLFAVLLPLNELHRIVYLALSLTIMFVIASSIGANDRPLSFYGNTIVFEFWIGVALAVIIEGRSGPPLIGGASCRWLLYGVWTLGMAALLFGDLANFRFPRVVVLGVPAMIVVGGAIIAERHGLVPRIPWLERIGDSSYSLYLTHGFVVAGLRVGFTKAEVLAGSGRSALFITTAIIVSAIVGLLTYRWLERPLVRIAGDRRTKNNGRLERVDGSVAP